MTKRAVVLLSGGLDSTTCLAYAVSSGYDCYTLSFDYGQKQRAELNAAKQIAYKHSAKRHEVVALSLRNLGGSALTDDEIDIPHYQGDGEIPCTYVPARNTTFLSIALGWAEILKAQAVFIGVSAVDYSGYPDCRPAFIKAFQQVANQGTKAGVEGEPIDIQAPFISLDKAQTIELGNKLGVDYRMTVTCYALNEQGEACGVCDSCVLRKQGFVQAGRADPTVYQKPEAAQ
jgi:7-cyano-7-deazaguanine synthase